MAYRKKYKKKNVWLGTPPMFVDREVVLSEAYFSLPTSACYIVYGIFLTKRVMKNRGDYDNQDWFIANNGEITFTWKEALKKYGLSDYKFEKAIENFCRAN